MFEINIAKNGQHYCKVVVDTTFETKARQVYDTMCAKFHECEWELTLMKWETFGTPIDVQ